MEGRLEGFGFKLFYEQVGYEGADGRTHGCTMNLFIILTLEEVVGVFEAELQKGDNFGYGHLGPCGSEGSCVILCLTMFTAWSTGTEVNKAMTSYEEMTSPCSNVTC